MVGILLVGKVVGKVLAWNKYWGLEARGGGEFLKASLGETHWKACSRLPSYFFFYLNANLMCSYFPFDLFTSYLPLGAGARYSLRLPFIDGENVTSMFITYALPPKPPSPQPLSFVKTNHPPFSQPVERSNVKNHYQKSREWFSFHLKRVNNSMSELLKRSKS